MKQPRRFVELECKDEFDNVMGYAPVKCVLFSETKEYSVWGIHSHYVVSNEVVYHSVLNEFVNNDNILDTKHKVYELFDNYEDCKKSCIINNERLLQQKLRTASIQADAHKLDAEQKARYIEKKKKQHNEIQKELFETTDKLYGEKTKSLDGSKAKQVVEKVNNDKENQGK